MMPLTKPLVNTWTTDTVYPSCNVRFLRRHIQSHFPPGPLTPFPGARHEGGSRPPLPLTQPKRTTPTPMNALVPFYEARSVKSKIRLIASAFYSSNVPRPLGGGGRKRRAQPALHDPPHPKGTTPEPWFSWFSQELGFVWVRVLWFSWRIKKDLPANRQVFLYQVTVVG